MSDKEQLIKQLADLIGPHVKKRGDLVELLDQVAREIWRREDAQQTDDWRAKLEAFKAETGGLTWPEFAAKYGLHDSEQRAAANTLPRHRYERGIHFFADIEPSPDQRQQIADETTMSKRQACEYLGISPGKFDKLKKQHKLEHVGNVRVNTAASGYIPVAYLYRLTDIRRLADQAK